MLDKVKRNKSLTIFCISVFFAMLIFYISAHPLYIYDVDDWAYINETDINPPAELGRLADASGDKQSTRI